MCLATGLTELDPHHKITPDEGYIDYSVSSDAGDDSSDSSDMDNGPDTGGSLNASPCADHNISNHGSVDNEDGHILTGLEMVQSLEGPWTEPTIVHYPGNRAGEVCFEGIVVIQEYKNALGGPSKNPYSPFGSQIDWELAKWAKLRGPSATSFTELLNVSRVSATHKTPSSRCLTTCV